MRFRNVAHLTGLDHGPVYVFIAQRLQELTFDYSLDSHKAPSVSVPSLIYEGLNQAKIIQNTVSTVPESSFSPIIQELTSRMAGNPVVRALLPSDRKAIDRLGGAIDLARATLDIISNELEPRSYAATTMDLIVKAVERKSKFELDFLLRELVSTLENLGMSRAHIYFSSNRFFYEEREKIAEPSDLRKFFEIIFPHLHDFTVALKVTSFGEAIDDEHFSAFGLELKGDIRDDFENFDPTNAIFDLSEGQVFLLCEGIEGYDRFSAIAKAVQKASLLQNLFRLYHHSETMTIDERVIVSQCCTDEIAICNRKTNKMLNLEDERPKKAALRLKELLGESNLLRGGDASRLISLSEFHGMGIDATTVENQVINLWISLETIAPSRSGHSKIANVLAAILPVTSLSYTNRLVRRAAVDLFTWSRFKTATALREVDPVIDEPYGRVLAILTLKEHNEKFSNLLGELKDFELLRYRLFKMYEIFSEPKKLIKQIEDHQQRVEWQIRRIYRTRNSIVHRGEKPPFIDQIVDNAHEYLDQAITLTLDVSRGLTGMHDYEECFNFLAWENSTYLSRLADIEEFDSDNASLALWVKRRPISREDVLRVKG